MLEADARHKHGQGSLAHQETLTTMISSWSLYRYTNTLFNVYGLQPSFNELCSDTGLPETDAMNVVLLSSCKLMQSKQRQQKQIHVRFPSRKVSHHLGVSSKRADRDRRASGGKRCSDGKASPLVLIMGLSGPTVLPDGSTGRGSAEARRTAN
jgi:hypothetical protein